MSTEAICLYCGRALTHRPNKICSAAGGCRSCTARHLPLGSEPLELPACRAIADHAPERISPPVASCPICPSSRHDDCTFCSPTAERLFVSGGIWDVPR